jgi:hypothetical protein
MTWLALYIWISHNNWLAHVFGAPHRQLARSFHLGYSSYVARSRILAFSFTMARSFRLVFSLDVAQILPSCPSIAMAYGSRTVSPRAFRPST